MTASTKVTVAAHLAAMCLVLLPIVLFPLPPLVDFPKTVAQMYLVSQGPHSAAAMTSGYDIHWGYLPYLGHDLLSYPLLSLFEPTDAGRAYLAITLVLTGVSPAIMHAALFRTVSPWPLFGWLLVYHHMLYWSFFNYILAVPLIIFAFTAWLLTPSWSRPVRALLFTVFAFVLMTFHLFAWGAFGLLVAGQLIGALKTRRWSEVGWSGVPFLVSFLLWRSLPSPIPNHSLPEIAGERFRYGDFAERVRDLISPVNFDYLPTDILLAAAAACLVYWAIRDRTVEIHALVVGPVIAVAGGSLLMPHILFGAWGTMRLPIVTALVLIAATRPRPHIARRHLALIAIVGCGIFAFRMGEITFQWSRCQPVLQELRQALHVVRPGASLVTAISEANHPECLHRPVFTHVASYAVIDRGAFSPEVGGFSVVHPKANRAPLRALGLLEPSQLDTPMLTRLREDVDFLLYLHPGGSTPRLNGMTPIHEGSYFTVFESETP